MRALRAGDSYGRYRIDRQLGAGGMGVVYAATDTLLDRPVALKLVTGRLADDPEFLARFHREAEVLARLSSPHVIQIYDHGEQDGRPYIATQLVGGGDLADLIALYGALPPALAVDVATQLADGLAAAHGVGVVHRDLKPANVLVHSRAATRPHVYLCDFGIAQTDSRDLTRTGVVVVGTRAYLAPESHQGRSATVQTDVYALGCVLFEMLTGRAPYAGSEVGVGLAHVEAPVPRLPGRDPLTRQLNHVLARALAKDPRQRYPEVASMRADLAAVGTRHGPASRRRRWPVIVGAAAAVIAVLSLVSAAVVWWPESTPPPGKASACAAPASNPGEPRPVDGDFDADGHADVTVSISLPSKEAAPAEVVVLPSDGTTLGAVDRVPVESVDTMLGDLDGDRVDDLVYVSSAFETTVHVWHADGSFDNLSGWDTAGEGSWGGYWLADVTGDGRDDLVRAAGSVADPSTFVLEVAVSTGRELRAFESWYQLDALPSGVGGDFDGDGKDDLAVRDESGRLRLLRSTGKAFVATRTAPQLSASADDAASYLAADFDGDGDDELARLDSGAASSVTVICATEDGFAAGEKREVGTTGSKAEVPDSRLWQAADLDGDGRADIVGMGPVEDRRRPVLVWLATDDGFRLDDGWGTFVCGDARDCTQVSLVRRETDWLR